MEQQHTLTDIKQTIVFNASIQKVWNVVSTAEGIASWFMPNDFVLEVGHEFHVQSPFGPSPCKVLEIDEPNHLSFSWDTDGWVVSFHLKAYRGCKAPSYSFGSEFSKRKKKRKREDISFASRTIRGITTVALVL